MTAWPAQPLVHEVFAWPWLTDLSAAEGRVVTLADVPDAAWDAVVVPGADAVWLMGVWERSPLGRAIALADAGVVADCRAALPDMTDDDVVGSPYCVHDYTVDTRLGGHDGLAAARAALAERGVKLLVDFVPNHVAPDHPWVATHHEYFVPADEADEARDPDSFLETANGVFAFGRDPNFAPWRDVLQLDPLSPELRDAVVETLLDIAFQADGARCDMAMLALDDVVATTWGGRVGPPLALPYWSEVISRVRAQAPDFLFVAEAYWDREPDLIGQGFDHAYDKRLYDRLVHDDAASVRAHLGAEPAYQRHLIRFLENHDEPRAATVLPPGRDRAAAVTITTLPGAVLLHDGQLDGRRVRLPVQLGRRPAEPLDAELRTWWTALLDINARERAKDGRWSLLMVDGWPDNQSAQHLAAWQWAADDAGTGARHVVVVNLSGERADGRVRVGGTAGHSCTLTDLLTGVVYPRSGDAIDQGGLYVGLDAWGQHLFRFEI